MHPVLFTQRKTGKPGAAAAGLLAACVGWLLTGCHATLPPEEPPPHQGVRLGVVAPAAARDLIQARSRPWAARQQAEVATEGRPGDALAGDVAVIAPAELPRWAAAGALTELPESMTRRGATFEWPGLLPEYREQILLWQRRPFAVPLAGEAPLCVYRSDLYADPDTRAKYLDWQRRRAQGQGAAGARELRAPATWAEFADQAEFFRELRGKPSLPPLPAGEAELDRLFYAVAAPYARRAIPVDEPAGKHHLDEVFSFHFDHRTGEPRIATPGFVAALELLQRLRPCRPAGTSAAPEDALLDGQAVLGIVEASVVARLQGRAALRDRFGICPVPGADRYHAPGSKGWVTLKDTANRVPYLGGAGWLAVVPASSKQPEAALDLLAEMAGRAGSRQTAVEPRWAAPTRTEHLLRERWDSFDLDGARTQALKSALNRALLQHNIKNPALALRTPDQAAFRAALAAGLRGALLEGQPAGPALAEVSRRWQALIDARGADAHRRDYRLSLGLLGQ